ncbi:metallophosphoesterase [Cytophagaceae bacterium DM2B3-1]|uniref:Metallophosphoesterase n=1 Tax=Xanthocytophaga flava TaxID=3048013 RepID=A0ABT7CT59_9BACT|nr:metallophosphoesterase [Xanthocytophaga flavus]MDJ1496856.1 metallophosphoesterase [Xanthocytophaga flavus]
MKRRTFLQTSFLGLSISWSKPFRFSLEKDNQPVFRFAVASDGHYGQPDTSYEADFSNLNKWLKGEKAKKGLDLIFINGDLFHDDPVFIPKVKSSFNQLPVPYYVTRGNHDRVNEDTWKQTWGYVPNHDFVVGDYAFVLADTSNEKGEYLCADAAWLEKTLQKHAAKKWIFVFMHIPPNKKWTDSGVDCVPVQEILEKTPNLAAVFHGHDHEIDDHKVNGGKHFFFDGHFGGNWGTTYKGYRIVEIYKDSSWSSYQCNPTLSPIINTFQVKAN